jgi:hypothetical protein
MTQVEANNLKLNLFPESIRELKRIGDILNSTVPFTSHRFEFINKTMKNIHFKPTRKVEEGSNIENILTIKPHFREKSALV